MQCGFPILLLSYKTLLNNCYGWFMAQDQPCPWEEFSFKYFYHNGHNNKSKSKMSMWDPGVHLNGFDALHQCLVDFRPVPIVKPEGQHPGESKQKHQEVLCPLHIYWQVHTQQQKSFPEKLNFKPKQIDTKASSPWSNTNYSLCHQRAPSQHISIQGLSM